MKTAKLIAMLQAADPSGEIECCVGNVDITDVWVNPAYYDGSLQVVTYDDSGRGIGKYFRSGNKVVLNTTSIHDGISNDPKDFTVDYSELSPERAAEVKKTHDELRAWHRRLDIELELQYFGKWATEQAAALTEDTEDIKEMAEFFFRKHLDPDDPLPADRITVGEGSSYIDNRRRQWSRDIEVAVVEGFLKILKREGK